MITVSIVTYFTPLDTLKATIESVRRCTLPHKIIIADNSCDSTYFSSLLTISGIHAIRGYHNGGYGYGHNLARKIMPPSDYHLVLNPDVIVHDGCIETLIAEMEKDSGIGMALPMIYNKDGTIQYSNKHELTVLDILLRQLPSALHRIPVNKRRLDYFVMADMGYNGSFNVPYASGCFMLFRRVLFDAIGGFDERFFMHFEDADISRRVRAGTRIVYFPQATITHLWTRNRSWRMNLIMLKSAWLYFQKWGWQWW